MVFSDIDVDVHLNDYDVVDANARDESGDFLDEAPVNVSLSARVMINGGASERRVEGLELLGDGTAVEEVGSAAFPQTFSFTYAPSPAVHGQAVDLQFRYRGSTFYIRIEAPAVEITWPSAGEVVSADQVVRLAWTGADAEPAQAIITLVGRTPACIISYRRSGDGTFVPERGNTGQEPPCRFEISADWLVDTSTPPSPFRRLRVERAARRVERFNIE